MENLIKGLDHELVVTPIPVAERDTSKVDCYKTQQGTFGTVGGLDTHRGRTFTHTSIRDRTRETNFKKPFSGHPKLKLRCSRSNANQYLRACFESHIQGVMRLSTHYTQRYMHIHTDLPTYTRTDLHACMLAGIYLPTGTYLQQHMPIDRPPHTYIYTYIST